MADLDLNTARADFDGAVAHIATTDRHILRALQIGDQALAEVERLRAEVAALPSVGLCFHLSPQIFGPPATCTLKAGHIGAHGDGSAHWTNFDEPCGSCSREIEFTGGPCDACPGLDAPIEQAAPDGR